MVDLVVAGVYVLESGLYFFAPESLLVWVQLGTDLPPNIVLVEYPQHLDPDLLEGVPDCVGLLHFLPVLVDVAHLNLPDQLVDLIHAVLDVIYLVPLKTYLLGTDFNLHFINIADPLELLLVKLLVNYALLKTHADFVVSQFIINSRLKGLLVINSILQRLLVIRSTLLSWWFITLIILIFRRWL